MSGHNSSDRSRFAGADAKQEERIDAFEDAWESGHPPQVEDYLPSDEASRLAVLIELVHVDLERRHKLGELVRVESYLERFPDLQNDVVVAMTLIAAEYALRIRDDESLEPSEYEARFPQWADTIRSEFGSQTAKGPPELTDTSQLFGATDNTENYDGKASTGSPSEPSVVVQNNPETIGEYTIAERLGVGGMGTVYKAVHGRLGKTVAVKVLSPRLTSDEQAVARFEREMRAIGGLKHANVVAATDAGVHDGLHYLVMEYVDGVDLASLVKQAGSLTISDACELIRQAAVGLQHVHEQGLVHRDIKPSNLMLDRDGTVKLLDLGLARLHEPGEANGHLTSTGQLMGTFDYMPPEQTGGGAVDIRADIYSLGATLYKLLTGTAPFERPDLDTPAQKIAALVRDDVPAIERADVPAGLRKTIEKMLAKDPAARFATPAEVAESLARFCEGSDLQSLWQETEASVATADAAVQPSSRMVAAEPIQPLPARKRGGMSWLIATGLGLVFLIAAAVGITRLRTAEGELVIESHAAGLQLVISQSNKKVDQIEIERGENQITLRPGDYEIELIGSHDGLQLSNRTVTVTKEGRVLAKIYRVQRNNPKVPDEPTRSPVTESATGPPISLAALVQAPAKIKGLQSWTLETPVHRCLTNVAAFSPDGKFLATGGDDGTVRIWNAETLKLERILLGHDGPVHSLAWSRDGTQLASGGSRLIVWDPLKGKLIRRLLKHHSIPPPVISICWSSDMMTIYWDRSNADNYVTKTEVASGKETRIGYCDRMSLSPDGTMLAYGGSGKEIRIWDTVKEEHLEPLTKPQGVLRALSWSSDGQFLAMSVEIPGEWVARIHDRQSGKFADHSQNEFYPHEIKWSPIGKRIAMITGGRISFYELNAQGALELLESPPQKLGGTSSTWSPDGKRIAAVHHMSVDIHDLKNNQIVGKINSGSSFYGRSSGVSFEANGDSLLSLYHRDGDRIQACIWDLKRSPRVSDLPIHGRPLELKHVSRSGKYIAWGTGYSNDIEIYNVERRVIASRIELPKKDTEDSERLVTLAYSPTGRILAIRTAEGTIRIWDSQTKNHIDLPRRHRNYARLLWSHDGTQLAAVEQDNTTLLLWEAQTGKLLYELNTDGNVLNRQLFWSPNDRHLGTIDGNKILRIWDTSTGNEIETPGIQVNANPMRWLNNSLFLCSDWPHGSRYVYDVDAKEFVGQWGGGIPDGNSMIFDGTILTYVSQDKIMSWNAKSGRLATVRQIPRPEPQQWCSTNGRTLVTATYGSIRLCNARTGEPYGTLLRYRRDRDDYIAVAINATGHCTTSPSLAVADLLYVAETDSGEQLTLTPAEFEQKYGWKNDPSQVQLSQ